MFSFNKELGSTSLDAGFKIGWGITTAGDKIKTVPSVAGGICQVATTLFHTVFWSGYTIEERNWHLYWISSYASRGVMGLDATVDEEANLDFKFINPTPHHLLIQSWVDDSLNVNFALYSTKPDWTVKVDPPVKSDVVPADVNSTVIEEEQSLPLGNRLQVERATDGFVVTTVRHVLQNGNDRTLKLVSRYKPSRNVVLVGTGGKPPSGKPIVETNKPAQASEAKPTATPGAATPGAATPVATPRAAQPTPPRQTTVPGSSGAAFGVTSQPTPAPKPAIEATPPPAPVAAPTSAPARQQPTATPRRR
jgi:hypothetical protein